MRVVRQRDGPGQFNDDLFVGFAVNGLLKLFDGGAKLFPGGGTEAAIARQESVDRKLQIFPPLRRRHFRPAGSCGWSLICLRAERRAKADHDR